MKRIEIRRALCVLAAVLALAATGMAKPNFSGDWKMNASKSEFGPMPAPKSIETKIEHKDPSLRLSSTQVTDQGEFKSEMKYTTDGTESTNEIRGMPVKSVVTWDGEALKIESKLQVQDNEIKITDRWSMAEDGKSYTVNRQMSSPQGSLDVKIVYEKK